VSAGKCSLLVVDDEPSILPTLAALLAGDFEVHTANSADAAQAVFARARIDLILTDQRMPRRTGIELLEWVKEHHPNTVRLLMTGYGELEDAVEAINRGQIYYFLQKPWRTEELLATLRNAAEKVRNAAEKVVLERKEVHLLSELRQLNQQLEERVAERTRELGHANQLLQQRTAELEEAYQLLQQRTRELERLVLIDPLTGLFNRRAMDGLALAELKRHSRYQNPLSLGVVDVDHFKQINTDFDLTGGDEVLKGLARTLTGTLREVDSVGRVGGEEFLVIARETDEAGAVALAERIRSTVEQSVVEFQGHPIRITVSLGFAVAETGVPADYPAMYGLAANALSTAKKLGRNRFVVRCLEPVQESPTSSS
jgi:diguanylate cyclase (GGDEF)-like protein